ncbi:MAG: SMI1/KNR4 family protein [Firmicutes bacterium]|nr:SMI1/KNR4 family protein [Bacillota bacterium]
MVTEQTGEFPSGYFGLMFEIESGIFANGERLFQFFSLAEISEYYEFYNFAEYMPFALPFALDGCGNFYIFDFRSNNPCIYTVNSDNLSWDKNLCFKVADSFDKLINQDIPLDKIIKQQQN